MTDKQCPFEIGDRVRHRASKEVAIVSAIHLECAAHGDVQHIAMSFAKGSGGSTESFGPCDFQYKGRVALNLGLSSEEIWVDDYLLEHFPEDANSG